jgi:hypothetical protein
MNNSTTMARALVSLALFAATVFLLFMIFTRAAGAEVCSASRGHDGVWWSYRIIDQRKCWYRGRPGRSKNALRWTAQQPRSSVAVGRPEVERLIPKHPVDLGAVPLEPKPIRTIPITRTLTAEALVQAARPRPELEPEPPPPEPIPMPYPRPTMVADRSPAKMWLALVPLVVILSAVIAAKLHPKQEHPPWPTKITTNRNRWIPLTSTKRSAESRRWLRAAAAQCYRLMVDIRSRPSIHVLTSYISDARSRST